MLATLQSPAQTGLFEQRPAEALRIGFKAKSDDVKRTIAEVCRKVGLSEAVTAVFQPSASAEINAQNYIVHFQSGQKLLLRRCCKFTGRERYEALYRMLRMLREQGVRVPEFFSQVSQGNVPYFEFPDSGGKACWVFFIYIEADRIFRVSGLNWPMLRNKLAECTPA